MPRMIRFIVVAIALAALAALTNIALHQTDRSEPRAGEATARNAVAHDTSGRLAPPHTGDPDAAGDDDDARLREEPASARQAEQRGNAPIVPPAITSPEGSGAVE